jgi:type II secretory pathway predicted ATPase ExeA
MTAMSAVREGDAVMYEAFFALEHRPFLTVPDPDFLYWADNHTLAFTMLRYGVMTRAPITVITGEIGSGKTTLLRQLMKDVPHDLVIGLVSNMQAGRGELLHWVMVALDQKIGDEPYVKMFQRFQDYLIEVYASGRRVALIFDEAQNLSIPALEELRMLSNINADKDELLQLILVGQPQLRDLLNRPELTQFAQRVSSDFHLEALSAAEVESYIQHRLAVAGAKWRIFPSSTCALIHEATRGVPRLVNILCDLCLVYAFADDSKVVDDGVLRDFLSGARQRGIYQQFAPLGDSPKLVRTAR